MYTVYAVYTIAHTAVVSAASATVNTRVYTAVYTTMRTSTASGAVPGTYHAADAWHVEAVARGGGGGVRLAQCGQEVLGAVLLDELQDLAHPEVGPACDS